MVRSLISMMLLLGFAVLPAFSLRAESLVLNLDTCRRMALENNPDLRVSALDLSMARRERESSWNMFFPGITAGAGIAEAGTLLTDVYDPSLTLSGSLSMSLSLNGGLAASVKAIRLAAEKEEISYRTAQRSLLSAVETEFYYLITSASNLDIVKADMELSRKSYEQAKSNYENGMASELSLLQARVNASNQEPKYKQAQAAHEARLNEFLLTIGLEPGSRVTLEGSLETQILPLDGKELAGRFLPARLDIQSMMKDREILENKKKQTALSGRVPSVGLSAGWSSSKKGEADWSDRLSLGVDFRLSLNNYIPGSSVSVTLQALDDQISQTDIRLHKAYGEAETEIINLVNQLNTAADNIRISSLNIDLAEESFSLTRESFSRGLSQPLEVDDAQQALFSARQQYLSSQFDYLSGLIKLRDALGLESLDELGKEEK
jgi:outer membrane protein TolC